MSTAHLLLVAAAVWVFCGVLSAGFNVAYFQRHKDSISAEFYRIDLGFSVLFGMCGPVALLISFCLTGFGEHGWRLRR